MNHKFCLSIICVLALSACGFRAQVKTASLAGCRISLLANSVEPGFLKQLGKQIALSGGVLVTDKTANSLKLVLADLANDKALLNTGPYGQGQVYLLSACLQVALDQQPLQKICSQARMSENYNQQLSNLNEVSNVQQALYTELVTLIVLKLGSLHEPA